VRVLAQALFGNPDLLIMDATNDLDFETVWLENFFSKL
jgi:ATPase subunit of ABC transporter with duplicated ATPase domains